MEAPFMRTRGLIGTIVMGLMLLPAMVMSLKQMPANILTYFFAWLLVVLLVPQVLMLIRPRKLIVKDGKFIARGIPSISTPIENVYQVAHDGMGIGVQFKELQAVECKAKVIAQMQRERAQGAFHLHYPGFTFEQADRLRLKLGLTETAAYSDLNHIREYQQTVRQLTPRLFVTNILVGLNVLVYLLMVATGVDWLNPTIPSLLQWGANWGPYTTNGQGWRLLTCCFLHIGAFHLFFNMWALLSVGPLMERLLGNTGFVILYIVSGLCGSILSLRWDPLIVSAGASGAIFGVYGAMLGFLALHKDSMPVPIYRNVWKVGVAFLVFNFIFGWSMPGIDMAAHLGGALAGFVGGLLLSQPLDEHTLRMRRWRNLLLVVFATVMVAPAFFLLPKPSGPDTQWHVALFEFLEAEDRLLKKYDHLAVQAQQGDITTDFLQRFIEQEVLPVWKSWQTRLEEIAPTNPDSVKQRQVLLSYLQTKKEGFQLMAQAISQDNEEFSKQAINKFQQANKGLEMLNQK